MAGMYILEAMCSIKSNMIVLEFVDQTVTLSVVVYRTEKMKNVSKNSLLFKYVYSKLAGQNDYQFQPDVIAIPTDTPTRICALYITQDTAVLGRELWKLH
jgi:hypothetical protein